MPLINTKSEEIRVEKEGEVMRVLSQTEDVVVSQLIAPIPGGHRQHKRNHRRWMGCGSTRCLRGIHLKLLHPSLRLSKQKVQRKQFYYSCYKIRDFYLLTRKGWNHCITQQWEMMVIR